MPTIQHSLLGNAELHEPKGVATASSNETYVADGTGSGAWAEPEPKGATGAAVDKVYVSDGAGSGAWKTIVTMGWEDVSHGGGSQALTASTRTKVLNDAAGAQTDDTYNLPGATGSVWDSTNSQFDWSAAGLEVGDTVDLRLDLDYTVNTGNDGFLLELDMAVGGTTPFTIPLDERNIDNAGTQQVVRFLSVYIGSSDVLDNPAEIYVTADSAGDSIEINGWYVKLEPRNPRFTT